MKQSIAVFFLLFLIAGCGKPARETPVITIGDITVTLPEFETAYESYSAGRNAKPSVDEFLDIYISRKLILKEAEKEGLDKDPRFLQDLQLFWEQSLLKLTIAKKTKELSSSVHVSGQEIQRYYEKNKEKLFKGRPLDELYSQIQWLLTRQKQTRAIEEWIDSLKASARIEVNPARLGLTEERGGTQ